MCSQRPDVLAQRRSQSELFIMIIRKCQGPLWDAQLSSLLCSCRCWIAERRDREPQPGLQQPKSGTPAQLPSADNSTAVGAAGSDWIRTQS